MWGTPKMWQSADRRVGADASRDALRRRKGTDTVVEWAEEW